MSVLSKSALIAAVAAMPTPITRASLSSILDNMVDSYQDAIPQLNQAAIDALTPTLNQLVYNTDRNYLMQYNGTIWVFLAAMFIGDTAAITAASPKEGQLFYDTTTKEILFADGTAKYGLQRNSCTCVHSVKVSISSAQILDSYNTPVQLVAAPGSGKIIQPISITRRNTFVTTAYDTNILAAIGATEQIFPVDLDFLQSGIFPMPIVPSGATEPCLPNQPLVFTAFDGNPMAGDGTIDFYITYVIVDL